MKWRGGGFLQCLLVMLGMVGTCAHAQDALRLDASTTQQALAAHTFYYDDLAGNDDLAAARRHLADGSFQPLPDGNTSVSYTHLDVYKRQALRYRMQ